MGRPMDQRLLRMLMRGNSPCACSAGVTPTTWPAKCSLLLFALLPHGVQSLKRSLTGPSRLYWNPFHLGLLCPCPAAEEVNSKSSLTSAVLEYVSCLAKKPEESAAMVHKRQVERQKLLLLPLLFYYCSSFIIIVVSLLIAVHPRNTHTPCFLFGTDREGASQKAPEDFWDHKLRKITKLARIIPLDFLYACWQG